MARSRASSSGVGSDRPAIRKPPMPHIPIASCGGAERRSSRKVDFDCQARASGKGAGFGGSSISGAIRAKPIPLGVEMGEVFGTRGALLRARESESGSRCERLTLITKAISRNVSPPVSICAMEVQDVLQFPAYKKGSNPAHAHFLIKFDRSSGV